MQDDIFDVYFELDEQDMAYRFTRFLEILSEADLKVFSDLADAHK